MAVDIWPAQELIRFGRRSRGSTFSRPQAAPEARPITGYRQVFGLAVLLVTAGCAAPLQLPGWLQSHEPPYEGPVTQIAMIWSDAGVYANGNSVGQGLAGRIYLFGPHGVRPVLATGKLTVYVYDEFSPAGTRVQPDFRREFTAEELVQRQARDIIGPSYLVWVPITDRPLAGRKLSILVRFTEPSGQETLSGMASVDIPPPQDPVVAARF